MVTFAGDPAEKKNAIVLSTTPPAEEVVDGTVSDIVLPNPFDTQVQVRFQTDDRSPTRIDLFDARGMSIEQRILAPSESPYQVVTFDTASLAPGLFICVVSNGLGTRVLRAMHH